MAWLYIGDFNEILHIHEKYGGSIRTYAQMESFREAMEDNGLIDLGYKGDKFTWSNNREGNNVNKKKS